MASSSGKSDRVSESRVVVPSGDKTRGPAFRSVRLGWGMMAWLGAAFLILGLVDVTLTWIPAQFGSPEWEFGSYTATLNNLPIVLLGLGLLMLAAFLTSSRALLAGAFFYATDLPIALKDATGTIRTGLLKAIVKTSCQTVIYVAVGTLLAVRSVRGALVRTGG
jgi:hypothetical protein